MTGPVVAFTTTTSGKGSITFLCAIDSERAYVVVNLEVRMVAYLFMTSTMQASLVTGESDALPFSLREFGIGRVGHEEIS